MIENFYEDIKKYKKVFDSMTESEIEKNNQLQELKTEQQIQNFLNAYHKNECYLCNQSFEHVDKSNPCLHWILRRGNFKKKDFPKIYNKYGYHQITTYLRWCANSENLLRNINNLNEEKSKNKILSYTIRWKNIDWTFDCEEGDFIGHQGRGIEARKPHYHFQMRINNQQFINFNDYHVPFHDKDIFYLKLRDEDWFHMSFGSLGNGMQEAMDIPTELIIKNVESSNNQEEAIFHLSTMILCDKNPISGEEIYQAQIESKQTGKSMAYILGRKLENRQNTKIMTIVSPVENIPGIAARTPHKA